MSILFPDPPTGRNADDMGMPSPIPTPAVAPAAHMTFDSNIEAKARAMWDAMDVAKPSWDQLGDVTKSVWREKAAGDSTWPFKYALGDLGSDKRVIEDVSNILEPVPAKKLTLAERLALKGLK